MEPPRGTTSTGETPSGPPLSPRSSSEVETIPLIASGSSRPDLEVSIREAPEGSALHTTAMALKEAQIGDLLFGISGKELKENLKEVWEKDQDLPPAMRWLKRTVRGAGLVLGLTLNFVSRVTAFAVAAAVSPVVMVGYTLGGLLKMSQSKIWKNPRDALTVMFGMGLGAGAYAGAIIGSLGNLCIKTALSIEYEPEQTIFSKALLDNTGAAAIGAAVGTAISLVNPLFIRAIWVR